MNKIDVSMCCFYWTGGCEEGGLTKKCSDRNCYYKQLEQLKIENKNLKQCLNEIEKMCEHEIVNLTDSCINGGRYFEIIRKIKEMKGDE